MSKKVSADAVVPVFVFSIIKAVSPLECICFAANCFLNSREGMPVTKMSVKYLILEYLNKIIR